MVAVSDRNDEIDREVYHPPLVQYQKEASVRACQHKHHFRRALEECALVAELNTHWTRMRAHRQKYLRLCLAPAPVGKVRELVAPYLARRPLSDDILEYDPHDAFCR